MIRACKRSLARAAILSWALPLCAGCAARPSGPDSSVDRLRRQVEDLRSQLYLVAANALCNPDVQTLMTLVVDDCRSTKEQVCSDPKIEYRVAEAEPGGRFKTLMSSQPYAVFYPDVNKATLTLSDSQRERLAELTQPPWFPTTRFLVVANIDGDRKARAKRHAHLMLDKLKGLSFPGFPGHQIQTTTFSALPTPAAAKGPDPARDHASAVGWVFHFRLQKDEQLRSVDRPARGSNISNSIWVFRTDCRLDDRGHEGTKTAATGAQGS